MEPNINECKARLERNLKSIQDKMNDPIFVQELPNNGHQIASDFLESVKDDLNWIEIKLGRQSTDYINLSEAIAFIGSGLIRWATSRTRLLLSTSDFRKNKDLYNNEKSKIEVCKRLSHTFSNMEIRDSNISLNVLEVDRIVNQIYTQFQNTSSCYIATTVYGDSFSPEVIAFKEYRDNVLNKSIIGRYLITMYYFIAPSISKILSNTNRLNKIIKHFIFDPIYRLIKNVK